MTLDVFSIRTLLLILVAITCGFTPRVSYSGSAETVAATEIVPVVYPVSTVKSYREWKSSKVSEAENKIKSTTEAGLSLSVAQELSISDYFVGYLTKQGSLEGAIKEVAARLTPEEVAELMSAYAQHFFQTRPRTLKASSRADSGH